MTFADQLHPAGQDRRHQAKRLSYGMRSVAISVWFAHDAPRLDLRASQNKMQICENNCCAVK